MLHRIGAANILSDTIHHLKFCQNVFFAGYYTFFNGVSVNKINFLIMK